MNIDGLAEMMRTKCKRDECVNFNSKERDGEKLIERCGCCHSPAACFGIYERIPGYGCDECCGHGCEDGVCHRLEDWEQAPEQLIQERNKYDQINQGKNP